MTATWTSPILVILLVTETIIKEQAAPPPVRTSPPPYTLLYHYRQRQFNLLFPRFFHFFESFCQIYFLFLFLLFRQFPTFYRVFRNSGHYLGLLLMVLYAKMSTRSSSAHYVYEIPSLTSPTLVSSPTLLISYILDDQ